MKLTMIAGAVTAAALMAGGAAAAQAATGTAAGHAAGHRAGAKTTSCTAWAKAHTFVEILKAAPAAHGALTVTGYVVRVHCGGPDDLQFIPTNRKYTGHVLPHATIKVLSFTNGITFPRLPESQLPKWIAHDQSGRIFTVNGPARAITALTEQYHP
jgi:hypothetical protein